MLAIAIGKRHQVHKLEPETESLRNSAGVKLNISMGLSGKAICSVNVNKSWSAHAIKEHVAACEPHLQKSSIRLFYGTTELRDTTLLHEVVDEEEASISIILRTSECAAWLHDLNLGLVCLRDAGPVIQSDHECVFAAVQLHGLSLEFAAAFQDNRSIVMAAVQQNGHALQFASPRLQDDRACAMAAVRNHGESLEFATVFRDDKDVVLAAVIQCGVALRFASVRLQSDLDIVIPALRCSGLEALYWVPHEIKQHPAVVLYAELHNDSSRSLLDDNRNAAKVLASWGFKAFVQMTCWWIMTNMLVWPLCLVSSGITFFGYDHLVVALGIRPHLIIFRNISDVLSEDGLSKDPQIIDLIMFGLFFVVFGALSLALYRRCMGYGHDFLDAHYDKQIKRRVLPIQQFLPKMYPDRSLHGQRPSRVSTSTCLNMVCAFGMQTALLCMVISMIVLIATISWDFFNRLIALGFALITVVTIRFTMMCCIPLEENVLAVGYPDAC